MRIVSFLVLFLSYTVGFSQGSETFSNIPTGQSSYASRTWTGDNGLQWTASKARTDLTITGPAITVDGRTTTESISVTGIPGGIGSITLTHRQEFTGSGGLLTVKINGETVGSAIPITTTATASTISNIGISGTIALTIEITSVRASVDDITWTGSDGGGPVLKGEPSSYPTSVIAPNPAATSFSVEWLDAVGDTLPDGYLIKGSATGFASIPSPVDGVAELSGLLNKTASFGVETVLFTGLEPSTTYYLKIFPFTNSGASVNYKTDGEAPQVTVTTPSSGGGGGDIPAGYYQTATGSGATLKTNLYNIIKGHTSVSYNSLYTHFQSTDSRSDGKIWDMYSNVTWTHGQKQCGSYSKEGDCYNREHSFPASWFNDASPMYSDLFHLYPTDGYVNNRRSNYPFGRVNSPNYTSQNGSKVGSNSTPGFSGTVFEPIDEYKGDFARTVFYMVTRYENLVTGWENNTSNADAVLSGNTFPALEQWALDLYWQWHQDDPVSQKEIDRNKAIYEIQDNRNPYIDHPEYVDLVWGGVATAVELSNWTGMWLNGSVRLNWSTESEWESAGFELYRSERQTGTFKKVASIDPSDKKLPNGSNGGQYEWIDHVPGSSPEWYYRLDELSVTGERTSYPVIRVEAAGETASFLKVHSIWPNPFNPSVHVDYSVAQAGEATISVVSVLGQVQTSQTVQLSPGRHEWQWSSAGQPVASGVYFIIIQTTGQTISKPVVYLK